MQNFNGCEGEHGDPLGFINELAGVSAELEAVRQLPVQGEGSQIISRFRRLQISGSFQLIASVEGANVCLQ